MGLHFVRPETTTLRLSEGDWILVKQSLSWGEYRAMLARLYPPGPDGTLTTNRLQIGLAQVTAYLLDWSAVDAAGRPIVIRDRSIDDLTSILDQLDPESFAEIREAITTHIEAMERAREEKKRIPPGEPASSPTSPSRFAAAGASTGSANSIAMTT